MNSNRLIDETSPYLLQHAHNPVDWYAWKEEAFEKARQENKPILVSIGYSTCHWCHVMERESFEDEEVAAYMNAHFVNIKVDREERPDVDQIYMEACQALTGSGGWPLNAFLLPDGRPFYAGTYFPPQSAYNRPSWMRLLQNLHRVYTEQHNIVEEQAEEIMSHIRQADQVMIKDVVFPQAGESLFDTHFFSELYNRFRERYDRQEGGFGGAPKFPGTMALRYLLDYSVLGSAKEAQEHVLFSIEKMIRGGIYDQLGGGFARYSVDREWLVPHFEKMIYDNALLVSLLSQAYKLTGASPLKQAIEETLEFVEREMTSPEGGIYSALDADSEGVEGKFYVWDKEEIEGLLGEEAAWLCRYYGVEEGGNWEGHNILHRQMEPSAFAALEGLDEEEVLRRLPQLRNRLMEYRSKRVRPGLDDKVLLSWNALQCTAYAHAFQALGKEAYRQRAIELAGLMLEKFAMEDHPTALFHTYKAGKAQYAAFLEDYALLIEALFFVYEISYDTRWLEDARRYIDFVVEEFWDAEQHLFYFTAARQEDLVIRRKDLYDSAMPSGNSTMAGNLLKAAVLFDREEYHTMARGMLLAIREAVGRYPVSFSRWARFMLWEYDPAFEVAIVGKGAHELADQIHRLFIPNLILMVSEEENEHYPLLAGKNSNSSALIYVCKNYACRQPLDNLAAFKAELIRERQEF